MEPRPPFAGLTPCEDRAHIGWVMESLVAPSPLPITVGFRVPVGFESILRIHHRPTDSDTSWDVLRQLDKQPHKDLFGDLDDDVVDAVLPSLTAMTETPGSTHFAQWIGWGDLERGSSTVTHTTPLTPERQHELDLAQARYEAAQEPVYDFVERCPRVKWWGGRTMFVFDGSIEAVTSIASIGGVDPVQVDRRAPQWWWPDDRAWFVATEIDDPCTYIAGSTELTERIEQLGLDTKPVRITDSW